MVWRLVRYASRNIIRSITSLIAHLGKYSTVNLRKLLMRVLGMFNCLPAQQVIALRKRIFLRKFSATDNNLLCRACTDNAVKEIASLTSVGS